MKKVCVFLGAKNSVDDLFISESKLLGIELASKKLEIVYGGANCGMMGALADGALSAEGKVTGIIPKCLIDQEISHSSINELIVVNNMHERKSMMVDISDAFIVMPGGLGTLEEMFDVWNALKIGLYKKPLGLLNINGFFDPLLKFVELGVSAGFLSRDQEKLLTVSPNRASLIEHIIASLNIKGPQAKIASTANIEV